MKYFGDPKQYYSNSFLLELPIVEIDNIPCRKLIRDERYTVTSCQCYGDCDCYGSIRGEVVTYFRKVEFDGTNKMFYDEEMLKTKINNC